MMHLMRIMLLRKETLTLPPTDKHREALKKMGEAIVIAMEEG